jgi:rfaE bifunctional protein kinase chain/domain
MNTQSLEDIFSAFERQRVLIIGDVMVDSYISGNVNRISPEAPVPILHVQSRESRLGGAANVALNIQSLGATPVLCSIIGDDDHAATFLSLLEKRGMSTEGIIKSSRRTTTVKHRVISDGHHLLRIDEEIDQLLDEIDRKTLISHIERLLDQCDVVIFEDYDKGCLDEVVIKSVVKEAQRKGKLTAADPKKRNFFAYQGVSLFKPNLKELKEGLNVGINLSKEGELEKAVSLLQEQLNFERALITLSQYGVYHHGQNSFRLPAHVRSIADVSGAGDTVISIAALCMALGLSDVVTAELANLGGGIVCEYSGVVPIDRNRLLEEGLKNDKISEILA